MGLLAAIYPGVWGLAQLGTGALSDRLGRKGMIVGGMWLQAAASCSCSWAPIFSAWALAMGLLGLGTALVYPTLLAAISDVAHPDWRASAVGVYRLWRDGGYAIGALIAGIVADLLGVPWAIAGIAALTFASGLVVLARMYETLPGKRLPMWKMFWSTAARQLHQLPVGPAEARRTNVDQRNTAVRTMIQQLQNGFNETLDALYDLPEDYLQQGCGHACARGGSARDLLVHNIFHEKQHTGQVWNIRDELRLLQGWDNASLYPLLVTTTCLVRS